MAVYGKPFTSEMLVTERKVKPEEGLIRIFEDKERPSPEYVCSADGRWVLPERTKETVAREREDRYRELGADELLDNIVRDERLGRDVTAMQTEWESIQVRVREELPYPKYTDPSYYQAIKQEKGS